MLRLGHDERTITEIMAVAEHVAGLTAGAAAMRLSPDVPEGEQPAAALGPPSQPVGDALGVLAEIGRWAEAALGTARAPAFWRVLAHQPRLLAATWAKDRLVLGAGRLDAAAKACIALAVASFRQSPYWIAYYTALVRSARGFGERELVELPAASCTTSPSTPSPTACAWSPASRR